MRAFTFRRGSRCALAGLLAAVALVGPPAARGQPRPAPPPGWGPGPGGAPPGAIPGDGTDLFRALLDRAGIEPVHARELNRLQPDAELIVIVIGAPSLAQWNNPPELARQAVAAGGAALIASDSALRLYAHDDPRAFNQVGSFRGEPVLADAENPRDTHGGMKECPYAVPVSPDELPVPPARPGRVWDVFRGLTRVATNQPTSIVLTAPRAEYRYPLARLPRSAFGLNGARFARPPLLAVGGDGAPDQAGPGYSFLAVADSSIFINQMLMEEGTDNLEFALRTVEYLQGAGKERKRCLFFENGRVVERFDGLRDVVVPPRPPIPPEAVPNIGPLFGKNQDKLVDLLDAKAEELQGRDALHRTLVGPPGSDKERRAAAGWIEGLTVVLALAIGRLFLWWFFRARAPQDVPPPPRTGAGAAAAGPPGVFNRRQKELVRRNNVYEPVRALVREFFAGAGAPPDPGPRVPPLEVTAEVRKPDSLRQALGDLWRLAYGPPVALTAQRWGELEPYYERLKQAHAAGKWRFAPRRG